MRVPRAATDAHFGTAPAEAARMAAFGDARLATSSETA
jgi:hypothetical protein